LLAVLMEEEHTGGTACILDATAPGARRMAVFNDTEVSGMLAGGTVDRHIGGVDNTFAPGRGTADIVWLAAPTQLELRHFGRVMPEGALTALSMPATGNVSADVGTLGSSWLAEFVGDATENGWLPPKANAVGRGSGDTVNDGELPESFC